MLKNNLIKSNDTLVSNNIQDMLEQFGVKNVDFEANLSESQKKAFGLFKDQKNLLILGPAGTGKSHIIKTFQEYMKLNFPHKRICLTSTTGISAYNIGGMTIHSFMGIGTGNNDIDTLKKKIFRKKVYKERIELVDILIIDEISMLSASIFEKLNTICQYIRKDRRFFGGIQVIFTGDLLQLNPVFNNNKEIYKEIDERLIIESDIFNKEFVKNKNIIILKENFRQKGDNTFINLLSRLRIGKYTNEDIKLLESRKNLDIPNKENIVHLVTTNAKAQNINNFNLNKLKDNELEYNSTFSSSGINKELCDILIKELEYQFNLKGIHKLILKKGSRVMLIKNLDVELGLVNGAIGTIIELQKTTNETFPIVEFDNKIKQLIEICDWELEIDNCKVIGKQIPLMLAYSVTVHKSQSLTLESAVLDLEDCFCEHQVYVALSRLRSLDGMYLKSFNPKKITINKKMKDYLDQLN